MPTWQMAAVVFAAALTIRAAHVLSLRDAPFFTHLLGDAEGYDLWARRLAGGDWLGRGSGVFYQAPLYPYAIGSFYALFGRDLLVLRLLQAGVGALSCALVAIAASKWFDARAGWVAGLVLACYAPAVFLDGLIQKSVLDGVLVSALLVALVRTRVPPTWTRYALAGAMFGLLALNRENAIVLLPVVALSVWQTATRRRVAAVSITMLSAGLMLAPAAIRNLTVGGELHLTTSQLGPNFYIGNNPQATGTYVPLRRNRGSFEFERRDATEMAEADLGRQLRPSEVSAYWRAKAMDWIRERPASWLRLAGRKVLLLVNRTEAADTEAIGAHVEWSIVLRALAPVLHFGMLAPLGVLGMWITRERWRELWPLYAVCGLFSFSVVAFYVLDRYRHPLVPVLALFAGVGVAGFRAYWGRSGAGERMKASGLVAAAVVVCYWPLLSPPDMRALTHYNAGATLQKDGLDRQAEAEYRTALAIQPTLAVAHSNLGALLTSRGDRAEALQHCQDAVRFDPQFASAYVNLGVVLADAGRTEEAVQAFTEAVRLDPRDAGTQYNLGRALAVIGRFDPAIEHLQDAIRLEPARAPAYNTLGALLCSRGRLHEGIAHLQTAVRLDPSSKEAAANLEHALELAQGR